MRPGPARILSVETRSLRQANVRFQGAVDADFRNNIIYDWGDGAAYGEFNLLNYVGNYLKAGPSTRQKPYLFFHTGMEVAMPRSIFVTSNFLEGKGAVPGKMLPIPATRILGWEPAGSTSSGVKKNL